DIIPVIAYSFRNNFLVDDTKPNTGYQMLKKDMHLRLEAIPQTSKDIKNKNNISWEMYEKGNTNFFRGRNRDIWPPSGTTSTGGWVETQWNQEYPWNMYCPLDFHNGGRSVTGCVATALAQVINYHRYIDNAYFTDSDDYVSSYAGNYVIIDDYHNSHDFPSFPELNVFLDQIREYYMTNDELNNSLQAALSFAAGVSVQMKYSSVASGSYTYLVDNALLGKFGYDTATYYYSSHPNFYPNIQNDMMNARPVSLGITSPTGGHEIIVDGYNSGEDTYHLNFGWGGSFDNWYSLPNGMPAGFNVVSDAVMNIEGGVLPYLEIDEIFLTELNGDGDGEVNPGETAAILVRISNRPGFSTATDVLAILRCSDPRATINDSIGTYNNIQPGSSQINLLDSLEVQFAEGIGVCSIEFILHVTTNDGDYYADLEFTIDVTLNQAGWPKYITNGVPGCPGLVDINEDDSIDVIFSDKNGAIHCYNNNGIEFTNFPYDTGSQIFGSVAIADINDDGQLNIVTGSRSDRLYVLKPDGDTLFTYNASSDIFCTPAISDIDNNGSYEIIFGASNRKLYVLNYLGEDYSANFPIILPSIMYSGVGPAIADINNDGFKEIIVGCNDGNVYCVNTNGEIDWTASTTGLIRSAPTIVKYNDYYKILVGSSSGQLYIISQDGIIEHEIPLAGDIMTSPVIVDLEANGGANSIDDLIIIVGTTSGNLYLIDMAGNILPGWPYNTGSAIESTPIVADVDNNDIYDIIFGCNDKYLYGLGTNGQTSYEFPIYCGYEVKSPPAIVDIDEDGDYEIGVGTYGGLWLIDYKTPFGDAEILWPMYRYDLERTGFVDWTPDIGIQDNPDQYKNFIAQNFPNPVKSSTTISFGLAGNNNKHAQIKIYNIKGQLVKNFELRTLNSELNNVAWDGNNSNGKKVSNGVYFYRLETNKYKSEIKKMLLLR
nr:C10 family peptidase [Candidatus Cloacimonadota bacterium]